MFFLFLHNHICFPRNALFSTKKYWYFSTKTFVVQVMHVFQSKKWLVFFLFLHKNICCSDNALFFNQKVLVFFVAPAFSRVRYIGIRFSVHLSTFMSMFDIYVKISILINYKTKQPSNLAWNISLTSWLCDVSVCFSVRLSVRLSVCSHLCRSSTFMSKLMY